MNKTQRADIMVVLIALSTLFKRAILIIQFIRSLSYIESSSVDCCGHEDRE